jgi:hypothetical protein
MHTVLTLTRIVHVSDWPGRSVLSRCNRDWFGREEQHVPLNDFYLLIFKQLQILTIASKFKNLNYEKNSKPKIKVS